MLLVIRGSAHQDCALKLRINAKELRILVIFHNLRGYDSHFIMQEIGEMTKKNNIPSLKKEVKSSKWIINVIPNNMENLTYGFYAWKTSCISCISVYNL